MAVNLAKCFADKHRTKSNRAHEELLQCNTWTLVQAEEENVVRRIEKEVELESVGRLRRCRR